MSEWAVMLVVAAPVPTVVVNLWGTIAAVTVPRIVTLKQKTTCVRPLMVQRQYGFASH